MRILGRATVGTFVMPQSGKNIHPHEESPLRFPGAAIAEKAACRWGCGKSGSIRARERDY